MSIIYDALKKVELSNIDSKVKKTEEPKHKVHVAYILVVFIGFVIAGIIFGFLTKLFQVNTKIASKIKSQPEKTQDVNPYHELPNGTPFFETSASTESKKEIKESLVLNGVFFSQDEGYALINNQILTEGDAIEGATIKRITLGEVELESQGSIIKLTTTN